FTLVDAIASVRRFQQRWPERLEHLGADEAAREAFARVLRLGLRPTDIERHAGDLWPRSDLALPARQLEPGRPVAWPDLGEAWRKLTSMGIEKKPAEDPLALRLKRLR